MKSISIIYRGICQHLKVLTHTGWLKLDNLSKGVSLSLVMDFARTPLFLKHKNQKACLKETLTMEQLGIQKT